MIFAQRVVKFNNIFIVIVYKFKHFYIIRLSVETDKNRRLMDDLNLAQRRISNLETEVLEMRQAGDGRIDFQNLQREYDKILRENHDLKHRLVVVYSQV